MLLSLSIIIFFQSCTEQFLVEQHSDSSLLAFVVEPRKEKRKKKALTQSIDL